MMKKTAALFAALIFLLTACASAEAEPLAYQRRPALIEAELTTDTGAFTVEVTLTGAGADTLRLISPETVSGITVRRVGGGVEMTSGDTALPLSVGASERWRDIFALFELDGDAVSSVEESGDSVTVGVGASPERVFVTFVGGADFPSQIRTEDGSLTLDIKKYDPLDQITGGSEELETNRKQ